MRSKILLTALFLSIFFCSCKSQFELLLEGHDVPLQYKTAFELFEQGKYSKALRLFEQLQMAVQGTAQEDTVMFYRALTNYRYGDIYTAETAFQSFNQTYPRSPFIEESKFLRIDCMYRQTYRYELDQNPTHMAIAVISEYIAEHPTSEYRETCENMMDDLLERLDRKSFESAKLYYTIEDYKAAHFALKNVLKENADNIYREDVMYYLCLSSYKYAANSVFSQQRERYMTFVDDYYNFITEYPESGHTKELEGIFNKVQSILRQA